MLKLSAIFVTIIQMKHASCCAPKTYRSRVTLFWNGHIPTEFLHIYVGMYIFVSKWAGKLHAFISINCFITISSATFCLKYTLASTQSFFLISAELSALHSSIIKVVHFTYRALHCKLKQITAKIFLKMHVLQSIDN